MQHTFVNRKRELKFLEEKYRLNSAQMIVVYGRRRVGKTFLLKHFAKNKDHVYYLCSKEPEAEQVKEISGKFGELFGDTALKINPFSKWGDLFEYLHEKSGSKKIVFIIDEFPFLASVNNATTSVFQKYWDEQLSGTSVYLVLCGSSVAMMEKETLSYKSPIYGRRTGQWKVTPFDFSDFTKMFPEKFSAESMIKYYSITGGVPFYLEKFDIKKSLEENISNYVFRKGEVLYDEGESLLKQELQEPDTYMSILKAIAVGNSKQSEIANFVGVPSTSLPRYLTTLIKLDIIEKLLPITENQKSKKSLYEIKDGFFRFWFKFVYPNRSYIEEENFQKLKHVIDRDFNSFLGKTFENICKQSIHVMDIPIKPTKAGRWWDKDIEIDLLCIDENKKEALFLECKWSDIKEKEARQLMFELKEKSKHVKYTRKKEYFGLIAKNIDGKGNLKKEGFILFDINDIAKTEKHTK